MNNKNPYLHIDQQMVGDIYTSRESMENLTGTYVMTSVHVLPEPLKNTRQQPLLRKHSHDTDLRMLD